MRNRRHERVRELLKRELGSLFLREFPASDAGVVTVSEVAVAGDLRSALVYVTVVGEPRQQKAALDKLQRERKRLQGLVGRAVALKYTPELRFVLDEAVARGDRVLQILDELERQS